MAPKKLYLTGIFSYKKSFFPCANCYLKGSFPCHGCEFHALSCKLGLVEPQLSVGYFTSQEIRDIYINIEFSELSYEEGDRIVFCYTNLPCANCYHYGIECIGFAQHTEFKPVSVSFDEIKKYSISSDSSYEEHLKNVEKRIDSYRNFIIE